MVLKFLKIVDIESGGFSFMCVKTSNLSRDAKCTVLTAVLLNIQFFLDVMLSPSEWSLMFQRTAIPPT
jgi:hypothetical protein